MKRSLPVLIVELLIGVLAVGLACYAYISPIHAVMKWILIMVAAVLLLILFLPQRAANLENEEESEVAKLVLLDEDGDRVKEWYIADATAILIGKTTRHGEVDVDLAECEYASLINVEHAVMNRVNRQWYIEDAESMSGTGIRPAGQSSTQRLPSSEPRLVGSGDLIYIANTRLLVK